MGSIGPLAFSYGVDTSLHSALYDRLIIQCKAIVLLFFFFPLVVPMIIAFENFDIIFNLQIFTLNFLKFQSCLV